MAPLLVLLLLAACCCLLLGPPQKVCRTNLLKQLGDYARYHPSRARYHPYQVLTLPGREGGT